MTLIIVFEKKQKLLINLAHILFLVYLLPILINEKAYTTVLAFKDGSFEHILRGQKWPFGFDSIFSQVLIEFTLLSLFVLFVNKKID